ncbi:MAG: FkbM family methyltransferase [Alphaproteobacteria bacterium]|nr:FkbM family methyltransferase [Alphaproteobacteria bacterium]
MRPLSNFIRSDSVVFDVGAHAGQFTKLFAKMAADGQVYSFEPGSYALSILRRATRFNRLRNVTVLPFGLGDDAETLQLSVPVKPSGSIGFGLSHLLLPDRGAPAERRAGWEYLHETVEIRTLDQFVRDQRVNRLDFMKVDIEGWEQRMLAGAKDTIARFGPAMMIEVIEENLARAGGSAQGLFDDLRAAGYRAFRYEPMEDVFIELQEPMTGDAFFCKQPRHIERVLAT